MYLFTLREQRETRQSIGILATDECAHAADVGLLGSQIRRVTIGPSELFGPRGDELAMTVQQLYRRGRKEGWCSKALPC